ncbi:hypothetical protein TSUD_05910 [Trifolium subterraneum]|uniref:Uncharacterized protein n=1 Tax=Trifolium subterraneum TaxID=3900 RepID=A0A2Z6M443_TRISU|nr:hypothetical protein TSUD_05910 [Trifolium subterraneum]
MGMMLYLEGIGISVMGKKISFGQTLAYLPSGIILKDVATTPLTESQLSTSLVDLSDYNGNWSLAAVKDLIPYQIIDQISGYTPPYSMLGEDSPSWPLSPNGMFSTKSTYDYLTVSIPLVE